jgi:RNA polymerase sigma-70 factor, ECF subfamily
MLDIPRELLVRLQQGDAEAFEEVYKMSASFVYNVALRVLGNREDAQDASQDVFVTLFKKIRWFRFESSFSTWLYRITFNTALNYARKSSGIRKRMTAYDEDIALDREKPAQVTGELDAQEREKIVQRLLEAVNPDQRACLVMREMQGLSYEEISGILKININTVRSRLKRARYKLLSLGKKVAYAQV